MDAAARSAVRQCRRNGGAMQRVVLPEAGTPGDVSRVRLTMQIYGDSAEPSAPLGCGLRRSLRRFRIRPRHSSELESVLYPSPVQHDPGNTAPVRVEH